jgi:hypothetical protein
MSRFDRSLESCLRPLAGALLALCAAAPALAQFAPNERRISPHPGLVDFEISQTRAKIAWTDPKGDLWIAGLNRATGAFEPVHGRGERIASNTVANWNMFMWNGPEWIGTASGEQFYYSYYLPGKPKIANNVRMAVAATDATGAWKTQPLGPDVPRMAHISSRNMGDPNPVISYLDPKLNHYWRNLKDPASERLMPFLPQTNKAWRLVSGQRALLYTQAVDGVPQVFSYRLDAGTSEQLTFDAGAKDTERTVPWMWRAPEFGDDFVLSTVVDGSELRIYRKLLGGDGVRRWTAIHSVTLPDGRLPGSPEWFTYNGKSYVFMVTFAPPNDYATEVWVAAIDPGNPLLRKITPDAPYRARNDPEVFITDNGPLIYFNRYDPSLDPDHPLCADCSEGVYAADPGLAGR